jgi:hypothetical protein
VKRKIRAPHFLVVIATFILSDFLFKGSGAVLGLVALRVAHRRKVKAKLKARRVRDTRAGLARRDGARHLNDAYRTLWEMQK